LASAFVYWSRTPSRRFTSSFSLAILENSPKIYVLGFKWVLTPLLRQGYGGQANNYELRTVFKEMNKITRIINAIEEGDVQATDELLPLVYAELRSLAAQKLAKETPGQTLQATALVHEAYLRLLGPEVQSWQNRGHFFGAAAEAMRRILVDNARRKRSQKRGGERGRIELDQVVTGSQDPSDSILALNEALYRLSAEDPLKGELIKLRFFAGLSIDQAAQALNISRATAVRHWSFARAWLFREINQDILE
jgi:RNA polymerase sigma factor (TIGR02999 family)